MKIVHWIVLAFAPGILSGCSCSEKTHQDQAILGSAGSKVVEAFNNSKGWKGDPALDLIYKRAIDASKTNASKVSAPRMADNNLSLFCSSNIEQPVCQGDITRLIVWDK